MRMISDTEELKAVEYDIMCYIKRLCEENHLMLFLGGGTLLGAIRHHGFIPWDDDVDLMLPRKDYDKLIRLIGEDNGPYSVSCLQNDPMFFYPYARVNDTRTRLREECHIPYENEGINVELFPLDGIPRKAPAVRFLFAFAKRYMTFFDALNHTNRYENAEGIGYRMMVKILRLSSLLMDFVASRCRWEHSGYVACVVGMYGEKEIVPRRTMEKAVNVRFEDEDFPAPAGYRLYLTKHYGDYRKLPPKSKQVTGHRFKAWYTD